MSSTASAGLGSFRSRIAAAAIGLAAGFGVTDLTLQQQSKSLPLTGRMAGYEGKADAGSTRGSEAVEYRNCTAVRAAGAAPIRRGQPGYGRHLDRDGDGNGCE